MTISPEFVVIALLLLLLLFPRFAPQLNEGFREFQIRLQGGPPPPAHPLLSEDSAILNRRRAPAESMPRKRG